MTEHEEKAKELVEKFWTVYYAELADDFTLAYIQRISKQCALIAVEEIIKQWEYIDTYLSDMGGNLNPNLKYWIKVKQAIKEMK